MIPESHPRKESLRLRHMLTKGFEEGLVAQAGLIAHGRGEAFDYLLGERTSVPAAAAIKAAAHLMKTTSSVISVNGNTAALCPKEIVELSKATDSKLEVNLFYASRRREELIRDALLKAGAEKVYGVGVTEKTVPGLESERSKSDEAILGSDTVLVMLEDGDRTEKLKQMGKKVVAVDLNPLSRTAQMADLTVVDNVVRALPLMSQAAKEDGEATSFDNAKNLSEMVSLIRGGSL